MRSKSLIILIVFILIACKKDRLKGDSAFLVGKWQWVYTNHKYGWCEGNNFDENLSPDSEGVNYSLSFAKNGKIFFFKNEEQIEATRLVFDSFKFSDGYYSFVILLNNDSNKKLSGYGNGTSMNFGYFPFDGIDGCEDYDNYFVKE